MTRVIIAVVGALGLAFVWRAAQLYQGSDPLAYRMVLLIGVGMLAGLVELMLRATRVARLTDALLVLPKTIGREDIEKTNEPLRGLIESRLNGTPTNLGSAVFTSYLLGLLVMMGLLGTFMGLFETLAGAREALTASGDVTALREGLAAPMKGLSRAFGTSATGVACSALLGLGAVFLRRAETRFVGSLGGLISGPLFPMTMAGRQLAALEALAENREALPAAAKAIELATKRLSNLSKEIERGQRETSKEATDAFRAASQEVGAAFLATSQQASDGFRAAAHDLQAEVKAGVDRAATSIAPLLDRAVLRAGEGAAKAVAEWTARLELDAEERKLRDVEQHEQLAKRVQQLLATVSSELAAVSTKAESRDESRMAALAQLATQAETRDAERLAALEALAQQAVTRDAERLAALEALGQQAVTRDAERLAALEALGQQAVTRDAERLATLAALEQQAAVRDAERLAALAALGEQAVSREEQRLIAFEQLAKQALARESERLAALDQLARQAAVRDDERLAALERLAEKSDARDAERLRTIAELAEQAVARDGKRIDAFEQLAVRADARDAERLAAIAVQAAHADTREQTRLEAIAEIATDAALRDTERLTALESLAAQAATRDAQRAELLEQLSAQADERQKSLLATVLAVSDSTLDRDQQRLSAIEALAEKSATRDSERLATLLEVGERANARDAERLAALEAVAAKVTSQRADLIALLSEHAERVAALGAAEDQRAAARIEAESLREQRVAQLGERLEGIARSIDARAEVVIQALEQQLQNSVERAANSMGPLLDRTVERAAEAAATQVDRFTERLELEAELRLEEAQKRSAILEASAREGIQQVTREIAVSAEQANERDLLRLAAIEAASLRLEERATSAARAAEAIPDVVSRFLSAEEQRLRDRDVSDEQRDERLEGLIARIDRMADALEQRASEHNDRAVELEAKLDRERVQSAVLLVEKLSVHAASFGQGLDATASLVRDAAESVRSGGTELTAVAEMFTGAVDRYRDANERWLDSLTTIEGALDKKGGGEALDLLGAYLDQTREVFDHSLAFQRELFAELRALRAAPRTTAAPRTIPPLRQPDTEKGSQ